MPQTHTNVHSPTKTTHIATYIYADAHTHARMRRPTKQRSVRRPKTHAKKKNRRRALRTTTQRENEGKPKSERERRRGEGGDAERREESDSSSTSAATTTFFANYQVPPLPRFLFVFFFVPLNILIPRVEERGRGGKREPRKTQKKKTTMRLHACTPNEHTHTRTRTFLLNADEVQESEGVRNNERETDRGRERERERETKMATVVARSAQKLSKKEKCRS